MRKRWGIITLKTWGLLEIIIALMEFVLWCSFLVHHGKYSDSMMLLITEVCKYKHYINIHIWEMRLFDYLIRTNRILVVNKSHTIILNKSSLLRVNSRNGSLYGSVKGPTVFEVILRWVDLFVYVLIIWFCTCQYNVLTKMRRLQTLQVNFSRYAFDLSFRQISIYRWKIYS